MSFLKNNIANLYNPKTQSREELIEQFVIRQSTFKKLYREIQTSKMHTPEQHILVEGKRGMGKTTLLLRLAYEIEQDPNLNQWLIPLVFNEEEYGVRKLFKMWERVLEILAEKALGFSHLRKQMESLSGEVGDDEVYEKEIYQLLRNSLQSSQKKIVLFIDNFGDLLQKFNEKEAHRLRKILQTSADIRIIAASSVVVEAFYQYKHPFYEFFKIERLDSLDSSATFDLLQKLSVRHQQDRVQYILQHQKGRVETLRRLTGGVMRTMVLLFEIFVEAEEGNAFSDLEAILDRVTPLYKQGMDDLPAPQQEIVEAIALHWDAIPVKEIAEKTRMESKVISAQLQQLVKQEIIQKIPTSTKNHLYQIRERFFNIWYLMRNGRNQHRNKVLGLVQFLEEWYDAKALLTQQQKQLRTFQKENFNTPPALLRSAAISYSRPRPRMEEHEPIETTRDYLLRKKSTYVKSRSPRELELQAKARQALKSKQYAAALPLLLKMKEKNNALIGFTYFKGFQDYRQAEKYYLAASREKNSTAYNHLGILYDYHLKQSDKAEHWYKKAIENQNTNAIFNLALLYKNKQKNPPKAIQYFQMAIEQGDTEASFNLAHLYAEELKDYRQAIDLYQSLAADGNIPAMQHLAYLYLEELQDYEQAEYYFKLSIEQSLLQQTELLESSEKHPIHLPMLFLMARGAFDELHYFFEAPQFQAYHLVDRLKPIYYTLLYFSPKKQSNAYLRMGPELEETVKEIIAEVKGLQDFLGKAV